MLDYSSIQTNKMVNFAHMKAWIIDKVCDLVTETHPLKLAELRRPEPKEGELLIKVSACGVCHTEIDEIEGRTPPPVYPVVPGHQVVGTVEQAPGNKVSIKLWGQGRGCLDLFCLRTLSVLSVRK